MGKVYEGIDDRLREFILAQPVYFVATAPSGAGGHVNVSPKGGTGTLAVLGPHWIAYLDYTGSGAETIAHLRDNGRITVMMCAFQGPPKILRLYGRGRAVLPEDAPFAELVAAFPVDPARGLRSVIEVEVERVSDACGYQVPLMDHVGDRDLLVRWADRKSDDELAQYRRTRNAHSIDDLPALSGP
ncbi:pyridoxamine 5'-phosphate oxidase family protein [Actinoplanes sp. HUAS TT8]|uniref:pyridoxamine 5'-phosphate oxidase family protein n=1 Tax=Actinoplanes sp. HUAS TT8 TaxID=3447453 RepID=UPI003F525069